MRDEQARREEPHDREPDTVGVRNLVGDRTDVGDVETGRERQRESAENRPRFHRATL